MAGAETQDAQGLAGAEILAKVRKAWHRLNSRSSSKSSRERRWDHIWGQIVWAVLKESPSSALSHGSLEGFERSLVDEIHGPDFTITDLFDEIVSLKRAFADIVSVPDKGRRVPDTGPGASLVDLLDGLFEGCLAKTSLVNELVVEGSARGYCQVDAEGRITFANASMRRLLDVADCRGLYLPALFGGQESFVATALRGEVAGTPVLRRLDLVEDKGRKIPVTAEFGPISIDHPTCSGYAILVDVSSLIQAEYRAYEASKLGILKLDLDLCITYANRTVRTIFGDSEKDLVGVSVRDLFPEPETQAKIRDEFARRKKGEGSTYDLPYHRASDGKVVPLRINAMPQYDNLGAMTGVFVVVQDVLIDAVGQEIQDLIQEHDQAHDLFDAMFGKLKSLIEFDFGTISIYSRDMTVARAIHFHPRPEPLWPTQWFPISEGLKGWIEGQSGLLWQPDISAFLENQEGTEEIAQDPTVERLVREGYKAFICYPIWEAGRVAAVVCLMSFKRDFFDAGHYEILERVPIDRLVRTGLAYRDRAEHRFLHYLNKRITAQHHSAGVAKVIVKALAHFFQWQNVSIFKVNRVRGVFELLAQAAGPLEGFLLSEGYEQPLAAGVLGKALARGEAINLPDTSRSEGDAAHYISSNRSVRSELVLPIRILDETAWLLNLEDARLNAFSAEDTKTLERIVEDIEATLETTFKSMMFDEIFEVASDGVLITDVQGQVLKINPQARAILRLGKTAAADCHLGDFVPDEDTQRFLVEGKQIAPTRVMFETAQGAKVPVVVSGSVLPEEYGRRVIFLKEIEALEWHRDARAITAAVAEIVAQTRTPMSLASTLLHRAARTLAEGPARDLIERAGQQLSRAEITYDRVSLCGETDLPPTKAKLSLGGVIDRALQELGVKTSRDVDLEIDRRLRPICADAFELTFVVESILSYLLRVKPLEGKVTIQAQATEGAIRMAISAETGRTEPDQPLDVWEESAERARAEVVLGETAIRRFIVEHHKGRYERSVTAEGRETFSIQLNGTS